MPQTVDVLRRQQNLSFGTHLCNQILADKWRRHAELIFVTVVVLTHLFQLASIGYAMPSPIVATMARTQFVVHPRNRVAEGLKLVV